TTSAQPSLPPARASGNARVWREPEWVERLRARRDDHALGLEIGIEGLEPELAAEAGLLVAAERDPGKRHVRHVDPDRAGLDPPRQTMAALGIGGPDGRHQPVAALVRAPHGVLP